MGESDSVRSDVSESRGVGVGEAFVVGVGGSDEALLIGVHVSCLGLCGRGDPASDVGVTGESTWRFLDVLGFVAAFLAMPAASPPFQSPYGAPSR